MNPFRPSEYQSHKMVIHSQTITIRWQFADELFECFWPFLGVGALNTEGNFDFFLSRKYHMNVLKSIFKVFKLTRPRLARKLKLFKSWYWEFKRMDRILTMVSIFFPWVLPLSSAQQRTLKIYAFLPSNLAVISTRLYFEFSSST